MNNYQKFAQAVSEFVGETLTTKQLEIVLNEQFPDLKLANLFPAACSVTSLDGNPNDHRAPSSAPYPVLFLSKSRGSYTVLAPEQQHWPSKASGGRSKETNEQAQARIAEIRSRKAKETESETVTA